VEIKKINGKKFEDMHELKKIVDSEIDNLKDKKIDCIQIEHLSLEEFESMYFINKYSNNEYRFNGYITKDDLYVNGNMRCCWIDITRDRNLE
jgi:methionine synthase II (cobalamin-independent)